MDRSNENPGLDETITAVTGVQLHRYNVATLDLMRKSMVKWGKALSTPERSVTPHFIQFGFRDVHEQELRLFFNKVPTSFNLSDEQVDKLIQAGRELLRRDPDFQHLLAQLGGHDRSDGEVSRRTDVRNAHEAAGRWVLGERQFMAESGHPPSSSPCPE